MSTLINLLDQNSNVNDVDIMLFESSLLFSPCRSLGGIDDMVRNCFYFCSLFRVLKTKIWFLFEPVLKPIIQSHENGDKTIPNPFYSESVWPIVIFSRLIFLNLLCCVMEDEPISFHPCMIIKLLAWNISISIPATKISLF